MHGARDAGATSHTVARSPLEPREVPEQRWHICRASGSASPIFRHPARTGLRCVGGKVQGVVGRVRCVGNGDGEGGESRKARRQAFSRGLGLGLGLGSGLGLGLGLGLVLESPLGGLHAS